MHTPQTTRHLQLILSSGDSRMDGQMGNSLQMCASERETHTLADQCISGVWGYSALLRNQRPNRKQEAPGEERGTNISVSFPEGKAAC
jgi:hypothetical protein